MKKLLFLLLITAISCNTSDPIAKAFDQKAFPQKWQLVQITGSFVNSITKGEDMSYQEFYLFEKNGTFHKERVTKEGKDTATGTYKLIKIQDSDYFELTYLEGKTIFETCGNKDTEVLYIISNKQISGGSAACDGPGLLYERAI